jgi:hypothetical protein
MGDGGGPPPPIQSAPASTARQASSHDRVQDALRTGREADIIASMQAIVADKAVNATARQGARHYIGQGKASESVQERVQVYCP